MGDKRYDVIFSGRLVEGAVVDQVKANVAKLFKVEVAKVERLFGGTPSVLKKGVDEPTAKKYLVAMKKAGAICEARVASSVPAPAGQDTESPKPAVPSATDVGKSSAEIAAGEGGATRYVIKDPPASLGELSAASVDEPGTVLSEHRDIPPPQVDTDGLSMDEPGATLVEHEQVPEPQVDTGKLSMDEPGVTLVERQETPALEVDTGDLSMDEPGVTLVEPEKPQKPEIDTSKLSLS